MTEQMDDGTATADAGVNRPRTAGATLRAAREAQGLSISDIAARTRIAQRQLDAIERDDYGALPGIPYAIGFARAYARQLNIDEVAVAAQVRAAVNASDMGANRYEVYEPADPARVPSRTLAWTAALIALAVAAGFVIWRAQLQTPPTGEQVAAQGPAMSAATPAVPARPSAAQPVLFTAVDDVWLRIYDEAGERLKDGLMKKGETFTLPPDAANPMLLTGRPQALSITVGGRTIPPLGEADRTIADVPVSAQALLARANGVPATPPTSAAPATVSPVGASRPAAQNRTTVRRSASRTVEPGPSPAPSAPSPESAPGAAPLTAPSGDTTVP